MTFLGIKIPYQGRYMTYLIRLLSLSIVLLASCSVPNTGPDKDIDPYKDYNQKVFAFNQGVDTYLTRPIATAYEAVTPDLIEVGITNFFNNLRTIITK